LSLLYLSHSLPSALKPLKQPLPIRWIAYGTNKERIMIKNLFKTTWRNLVKNKVSSLINIGGLALGICCFFLLSTYIINELRYDRFHKNADRIAYVSFEYKNPNDAEFIQSAVTPTAVVPTFKQ